MPVKMLRPKQKDPITRFIQEDPSFLAQLMRLMVPTDIAGQAQGIMPMLGAPAAVISRQATPRILSMMQRLGVPVASHTGLLTGKGIPAQLALQQTPSAMIMHMKLLESLLKNPKELTRLVEQMMGRTEQIASKGKAALAIGGKGGKRAAAGALSATDMLAALAIQLHQALEGQAPRGITALSKPSDLYRILRTMLSGKTP